MVTHNAKRAIFVYICMTVVDLFNHKVLLRKHARVCSYFSLNVVEAVLNWDSHSLNQLLLPSVVFTFQYIYRLGFLLQHFGNTSVEGLATYWKKRHLVCIFFTFAALEPNGSVFPPLLG